MKYYFYGDIVNLFLVAHYLHECWVLSMIYLYVSGLTIRTSTFCSVIVEDENYVSKYIMCNYILYIPKIALYVNC